MRAHLQAFTLAAVCLAFFPAVALAQSATLAGVVMTDSTERPLASAEVSLPKLSRTVRTDSAGNFRFTGLKAGVHELVIRMVGYEPISASLRVDGGKTVEGDFLLRKLSTQLAAIEVREKASLRNFRLDLFKENRKNGGRYMTAELFENASGRQLGAVIMTKVAGVRVMRENRMDGVLATTRGNGLAYGPCPVRVVLNGLIQPAPFSLNDVITDQVIGVEFYTLATAPMEYRGTGGQCGTVVIWTK